METWYHPKCFMIKLKGDVPERAHMIDRIDMLKWVDQQLIKYLIEEAR